MSDQLESLKTEDVSIGDRPLHIPAELPVLPLREKKELLIRMNMN